MTRPVGRIIIPGFILTPIRSIWKPHKPDQPNTAFTGFTIKALSAGRSRDDPDRLLCPVRTLLYDLDRVKSVRGKRKPLFLSLRQKLDEVHPNTISNWICKAIKTVYLAAEKAPELKKVLQVRAHEVRAIASSWDTLKQVSLADIMMACR